MGVNCNVWIPSNVRIEDLSAVMAILMGNPTTKRFSQSKPGDNTWWTVVPDGCYKLQAMSRPDMIDMLFSGLSDDALKARADSGSHPSCTLFFHSEGERAGRYIHLYLKSTAFWIAVGMGVIKFFGGEINFFDTVDDIHYRVKPKDWRQNCPSKNPDWEDFHTRMLKLKALTLADFRKYEQEASYKVSALQES